MLQYNILFHEHTMYVIFIVVITDLVWTCVKTWCLSLIFFNYYIPVALMQGPTSMVPSNSPTPASLTLPLQLGSFR